jgi:hypothetical protein
LEEATSTFEVRHRFVANAIWRPYSSPGDGMLHTVFSGFTISPTVTATSGLPYTATLQGNSPVAGISTGVLRAGGTNRLPNFARNSFHFPNTANVDLRISRGFTVAGTHRIEGMVDIFNIFDRMNYTQANQNIYTVGGTAAAPTLTAIPTFGSLTNGNSNYFVFTPRQVQLALRYTF